VRHVIAETPSLHTILQLLGQLSGQLSRSHDSATRLELLKQIHMLLADADKIVESEMGAD
jgi:hypothetical protein